MLRPSSASVSRRVERCDAHYEAESTLAGVFIQRRLPKRNVARGRRTARTAHLDTRQRRSGGRPNHVRGGLNGRQRQACCSALACFEHMPWRQEVPPCCLRVSPPSAPPTRARAACLDAAFENAQRARAPAVPPANAHWPQQTRSHTRCNQPDHISRPLSSVWLRKHARQAATDLTIVNARENRFMLP